MNRELHAKILERLRTPRHVPQTTASHIATRVEVAADELAPLIDDGFRGLDEYEVEEHFAALFTPTAEDKLAVTPLLEDGPLTTDEVKAAIFDIREDAPPTPIEFEHGQHAVFAPNPWLIERFVRLLRMDHAPTPDQRDRVSAIVPGEHRAEVLTTLRERALSEQTPREMLLNVLARWRKTAEFDIETFRFLAEVVIRHKLRSVETLTKACADLEMTYRKEILHLESGDNPVIKGWKRSPRAGKGDLKRRDDEMIAYRRRQLGYIALLQRLVGTPSAD